MRVIDSTILINGKEMKLTDGMTRNEILKRLGEPSDIGCITNKRPEGQILLYGEIKLHLDEEGCLFLVYTDKQGPINMLAVTFNWGYKWET